MVHVRRSVRIADVGRRREVPRRLELLRKVKEETYRIAGDEGRLAVDDLSRRKRSRGEESKKSVDWSELAQVGRRPTSPPRFSTMHCRPMAHVGV